MSSDFKEVNLGNICDIKGRIGWRGYTKDDLREEGPIVIGAGDITTDFKLDISDPKHLTEEKYQESPEIMTEMHDILIVKVGNSIGKVAIILDDIGNATINPNTVLLKRASCNPLYLYYYLISHEAQHYLISNSSASAQPAINQSTLKKMPVSLPPRVTQDRIAETLGILDQKIHLNQKTNETLEAMAQAIFKSWFVDFDPVRAKIEAKSADHNPNRAAMASIAGISLEKSWDEVEFALDKKLTGMTQEQRQQLTRTAELFPGEMVDSELGEVPKGWKVKSLDKIADYLNGRAMQKYPPADGKPILPVLKIAQLRKGDTEGADIATADIPERFKIRNSDMIFSWSGSLLVKLWAGGDAALNQHLFKVTSNEYDQWFYYHWTKHHLDNFIRIAEAKAVTMGHIKRSHLKEAKCAVPDKELLEVGSHHIEPLLQRSIQLNLECNQLAELRDTLLPKLISGELEVHVPENIT